MDYGRYDEGDAPDCPCYDRRTQAACIPKSTGWGVNPNFASPVTVVISLLLFVVVSGLLIFILIFAMYEALS